MRDAVTAQFKRLVQSANSIAQTFAAFLLEIAECFAATIAMVHLWILFRRFALNLKKTRASNRTMPISVEKVMPQV